jgi:hypothetical protein
LDIQAILDNKQLMDAFVQKIAEEVIHRLQNKPKTALVVFSGAAIGFSQELKALEQLKDEGWKFKVFLSDAAMSIFTPDVIAEKLGVEQIFHSKVPYNQKDLYANVDKIIIAATTVNTAAKIANGIADNDLLTLVNHGLMAGVETICSVNGACPDDPERAKLGMGKSSDGFRKLLRNNLKAMQSFGIRLTTADHLYETCRNDSDAADEQSAGCAVPEPQAEAKVETVERPAAAAASPRTIRLTKHVISNTDIQSNRTTQVLEIPADALLTQSAAETMRELGITLKRV